MHPLFYPVDLTGRVLERPAPTGLLSGYGVFTTFIAGPGQPVFRLKAHYERLRQDCGFFAIRFPWLSFEAFAGCVEAFCQANLAEPQVVRVTVTTDAVLYATPPYEPVMLVSLRPIPTPVDSVSVGFATFDRLFPTHKHMNHIAEGRFLQQAKEQGFDDYLRVSKVGYLTESAYTNLFWISSDGAVETPDPEAAGCLPGIMRQAVIEACRAEGVPVREGLYPPEVLRQASGVFLTNTVRGLMPVSQVGEHLYSLSAVQALQAQIRPGLPPHSRPESWSCARPPIG
jgi:branched-subunit amino acid aminotransferase/4-amino-4-deoxychorismate lyase